jgi:mRNA-degrading endonuclease RelE of RelBE toxin-antitoxin system
MPEFGIETIREIIYHDYRIVYSIDSPKTIIILTVFHGSRLLSQPNP